MEEITKKKGFPINQTGLITFIVVVLVLASLGTFIAGKNGPQNPVPTGPVGTTQKMTTSLAPQTLVYGTWTQSNSLVNTVDLSDGKYQTIAALPVDTKRITVASPDTLIYINRTNEIINQVDQGKEIVVYSLSQSKATVSIPAADGYTIDDYVLSPNKNYLATWELAYAPGFSIPRGGRSRVYTVNLANPSVKNLIYDEEVSNIQVHYPSAIVDNGRVFLDTFLSNSGVGYSYGMSVANFDGTGKQDLDQMKNGTYGTQPVLSPDGTRLAFAGYDGSDGTIEKSGFRKAVLAPNTVEILDVNSLTRQKLANLPNNDIYADVSWDQETGDLLLITSSGTQKYSLATNTLNKVTTQKGSKFIATLSSDKALAGSIERSESCRANLGAGYQGCFRQFTVLDSSNSQETPLPLPDPIMQYIGFVAPNYFSVSSSTQATANAPTGTVSKDPYFIDLFSTKNDQKENLQLYTFMLKSDLGPKRRQQQSEPLPVPSISGIPNGDGQPRCRELTGQQCKEKGLVPGTKEYDDCEDNFLSYKLQSACDDSPLYLYGAEGQKVKVNINTYIYNSQPGYDDDGYKATLLKDGKMLVNGTETDSIKYDYTPGIKKITPPSYGTVTAKKELGAVLANYSEKLGLNQKETEDLIAFAENRITSPYVFISFFDQKKSEQILPLSFTPQPDNYLNIVFYFKQYGTNPSLTPIAPVFSTPMNRTGFTAVEISSIVE